jgi:hypothetical protein
MPQTKRKSKKTNKTRKGGAKEKHFTPPPPSKNREREKDDFLPTPPSSLSNQYKRGTQNSMSTSSISKNIEIFNNTITIQKGYETAEEEIFFGDFITTDINARFNLYKALLQKTCPIFKRDNAIKIIEKSIPGFKTSNIYPNILCSVALTLGLMVSRNSNIKIYAKGGFAIQNTLNSYKSGDIDFFMNANVDEVNMIGAYLQSISNECILDKNKRVIVKNFIRLDEKGEPDSSSVLKISVLDTNTNTITALVDISYVPSIATEMLYEGAIEKTIMKPDIYTPIFYFPTIKRLVLERLSYIDKFTSDSNQNNTDNPFKCSIVRSMNAFLQPVVIKTINQSAIEIDSIDILINLYIDYIQMGDESKQQELRKRIQDFIVDYSEEKCNRLKKSHKSKTLASR